MRIFFSFMGDLFSNQSDVGVKNNLKNMTVGNVKKIHNKNKPSVDYQLVRLLLSLRKSAL